jgi:hypothetical protein
MSYENGTSLKSVGMPMNNCSIQYLFYSIRRDKSCKDDVQSIN